MTTIQKYLAVLLASLTLSAPLLAQDAAELGPKPDMEPHQTVEAMLLALQKNSDDGIAQLYQFSSPGNRAQTGPLERFAVMIRQGFPDMLGHQAARMAPPLIDGDRAMVPVELVSQQEELSRYIFILSRQSLPECDGCWMADAVVPPEALDPEGGFGGPETIEPPALDTPA